MDPSPRFLAFFQKVTRRLADTFLELNVLCQQQKTIFQIQPSKQQQPPKSQQIQFQPMEFRAPIELESSQQNQNKEAKTKKIKKQSPVVNQEQKEADQPKAKKKIKKTSHKPKAPASSFLLFFKDQQNNMAQTYPNYGVTQLTKVAAKIWKDLSNEEKEPYIKLCDDERRLYQQKMEKYRIQFPHQIAEKQKDRKLMRKQKKNTLKNTPRKQKIESQMKNGTMAEQDPLKAIQIPKSLIEEEVIESDEQFMKGDMSDSLGMV